MEKLLDNLMHNSFDFLIDFIIALLVLIIGFRIVKIIEKALKKENKFNKLDVTAKGFIVSIVSISLKILLFVISATIVGIPTTSLITIIGSCALAIGLALQGGLSNLAGGLMILIFRPFKVGDYIESNSKEGTVKNINMFYTTLTTPDNKEVELPNGNLSNSNIVNYSANSKRRVDLEFSVSYDTKIDKVKKVLNEVINDNEYILKDNEIIVRLIKHADSSLIFIVRVWTKTENYWNTVYDLEEEVKEAFDKHNIEIPYPQLDIHNK